MDVVESYAIASRQDAFAGREEMSLNRVSDPEPSLETQSISAKPVSNTQFTTMDVVDSETTVDHDDTLTKQEEMSLNQTKQEEMSLNQTEDLEPSEGKQSISSKPLSSISLKQQPGTQN